MTLAVHIRRIAYETGDLVIKVYQSDTSESPRIP